jgi:hypothetical protein
MDEGGDDLDPRFRLRSHLDNFVECLIKNLAAVGIARAVLFDGADEDLRCADDLCPGNGDGEEMGVPEGDVGCGDGRSLEFGVGIIRLSLMMVSISRTSLEFPLTPALSPRGRGLNVLPLPAGERIEVRGDFGNGNTGVRER